MSNVNGAPFGLDALVTRPLSAKVLVRAGFAAGLAAMGLVVASSGAAEVDIDNGVVGDGHLRITVGDMGGFGVWNTQWNDFFDPSPDPDGGELTEMAVTFSRLLYLFVDPSDGSGGGTHRGIATVHPDAVKNYPDGEIQCLVTTPNSGSDGDLTTSSAFDCTGEGIDLSFTLTQTVSSLPPSQNGEERSMLSQEYTVTNNAGLVPLTLTNHIDEGMPWGPWDPFHLDDLVGADFAELGRFQVYAQDVDLRTAVLAFRTLNDVSLDPMVTTNPDTGAIDHNYYTGKQNLAAPPGNPNYPGGDCPEADFGTDFQIWDNYGLPNCWKNKVGGCGYDIPCISMDILGDTFIGLQTRISIGNGESFTITYQTLYGFLPKPTHIVHQEGLPGQTRPHSGYVDPRAEVGFPPDPPDPAGLTEAYVRFNLDVFGCDGSDVDAGDFWLNETGDLDAPTIAAAEYVDPEDRSYVRVEWDRPITPKEWTTLIARVCNAGGGSIEELGDDGPGVEEIDRVDMALLPCDVNQDGTCTPFDLLRFRQMANTGDEPPAGVIEDYIDTNRDGDVTPFDLLVFRQLVNGVSPATQAWLAASLNHPQP